MAQVTKDTMIGELLRIDEDKRHDIEERRKFLNSADIVFLCLPDAGAIEAVSLIENPEVRVIDASRRSVMMPAHSARFAERRVGSSLRPVRRTGVHSPCRRVHLRNPVSSSRLVRYADSRKTATFGRLSLSSMTWI